QRTSPSTRCGPVSRRSMITSTHSRALGKPLPSNAERDVLVTETASLRDEARRCYRFVVGDEAADDGVALGEFEAAGAGSSVGAGRLFVFDGEELFPPPPTIATMITTASNTAITAIMIATPGVGGHPARVVVVVCVMRVRDGGRRVVVSTASAPCTVVTT